MIVFEDVSKTYHDTVAALHAVHLHIEPGEWCFISGPTGAGKTTLLKLIYGLERPSAGRIYIQERELGTLDRAEVQGLRRHMGFIFQDFRLIADWSVYDNVAVVLELLGRPTAYIRQRVWRVLRWVGLQHRIHTPAGALSGGEKQRLALARAIVHDPDIILADEPVGSLDDSVARFVIEMLFRLHRRGTTVVIVSHDGQHRRARGREIRLARGRVVAGDHA